MIQNPNSSVRSSQSRKALLRRIGCLGTLSVFSSGVAFAQAPSPATSNASVVVPAQPAVTPKLAEPSPAAVTPKVTEPVAPAVKPAPEPAPVVVIETRKLAPAVSESPAPKPQAPIISESLAPKSPAPIVSETSVPRPQAPIVSESPTPKLQVPIVSESPAPKPKAPIVSESPAPRPQAPIVSESPAPKPKAPAVTASPTPNYQAPGSVVFTERKSGCEFSVNQGRSVSGPCVQAPTTVAQPSVNPKTTGIRSAVSKVISSVIRPNFATDTIESASTTAAPANQSSNWTPSIVTPPSSFVQNYFNRTVRPLGLPGNGDVRLLFPLSIPSVISSVFGWRIHPITGDQRLHTGTDMAAPMGTPVLAALTGRVIMSDEFGGYGLAVALEHSNGTQQTLYAHLSEVFVRPGEIVTQGTAIGRVGSTGASTGPHLHFEFRQQTQDGAWVAQDPGVALETALAQLVNAIQVSQNLHQTTGKQASRS